MKIWEVLDVLKEKEKRKKQLENNSLWYLERGYYEDLKEALELHKNVCVEIDELKSLKIEYGGNVK